MRCDRFTDPPLADLQDRIDLGLQDAVRRVAPGARSVSVPTSRRRARQRCTRSSETCHNEHTHQWAEPSATATSTALRTRSFTSAGTLAGSAPVSPNRTPRITANSAIHRIALTQVHWHQPARELFDRRKAGGDGGMEALRIIKRRLSDVVYRALVIDAQGAIPLAA